MSKKIKFGIGVIILCLIVIAISLFLARYEKNKINGNDNCDEEGGICPIENTEINLEGDEGQSISDDIYINEDYNFSLEIDPSIKEATVTKEKNVQSAEEVVEFKFDTDIPALEVYVYKILAWEALADKEGLFEIQRDKQYVYAYRAWEVPDEMGTVTEKSLADTISSFKLNN